ncbi:MAG: hypothetical protein ACT4OU_10575 [Hyphomicrobium sp.]
MIRTVHTASAIAALLMTSTASAVTITNRGDKEAKLTVIEGSTRQDKLLPAGKVAEGVCQKGCIIRLNDSDKDEYELEGSESVAVEEGFLYYDDLEAVSAPNGAGSPPKRSQVR